MCRIFTNMKYLLLILFPVLCLGCHPNTSARQVQAAFYCWETEPDYENWALLDSLNTRKIYLRLFDVAWDEAADKPYPAGPYRGSWIWADSMEPVPVVFITNETLQRLDSAGCADLAARIGNKSEALLDRLLAVQRREHYWEFENAATPSPGNEDRAVDSTTNHANQWRAGIREFQIDCDWTAGTRERYFYLLNELRRQHSQYRYSCTIRLHQFKDPKGAGVPPVERGMLMCYNTGDLKDRKTRNSIFSFEEARKYLENAPAYPLPLDVALPVFRWGVLFHLNQFQCIVPDEVWEKTRSFYFEPVDDQQRMFRARMDFTLLDHYVREGDLLRLEEPDPAELLQAVRLLRKQPAPQPMTIAFFHLGSNLASHETLPKLQALVAAFR